MNKKRINIIVVSFACLLLALVFIQLLWIEDAVKLKEAAFKSQVSLALEEVVDQLEKKEALDKLRSHETARFLFLEDDSIESLANEIPSDGIEYLMTSSIRKVNGQPTLYVKSELNGENGSNYSEKYVSIYDSIVSDAFMARNTSGKMYIIRDTSNKINDDVEEVLRKKIGNKTAFVGDIIRSLIEVNLDESIDERLDQNHLDSLLRIIFNRNDINTEFSYAILDNTKGIVASPESNEDILEEISANGYHKKLYPNDILDSDNYLGVYFPKKKAYLLKSMSGPLVLSIFIILAMVVIFYTTIASIIRQKKLTEIKNDFINNMTHELKTPISTISLAYEALTDNSIMVNDTLRSRYIKMIGEENGRLGGIVQNVLQHAVIDKGEFSLKMHEQSINLLISQVMEKMNLFVREKKGTLLMNLEAKEDIIKADTMHFTNVLNNLLDNAIKYCEDQPEISVKTYNKNSSLIIEVSDNGIGIGKENQKRIFDKLYRVPTGNIHNVKGFGLGLSYVKLIVEKHGGEIHLDSELGQGSTFKIIIPL